MEKKYVWFIKSNTDKYVKSITPNKKGILKFNWTYNPSEAKTFDTFPEICPNNSKVFKILLNCFYTIKIGEGNLPYIEKTEPKAFSSVNEYAYPKDALAMFLSQNLEKVKELTNNIKLLEHQNEIITNVYSPELENDLDKKDELDKFLIDNFESQEIEYSIPFWGAKYCNIRGTFSCIEKIFVFRNETGNIVFKIETGNIQSINKDELLSHYVIDVKPRFMPVFQFSIKAV